VRGVAKKNNAEGEFHHAPQCWLGKRSWGRGTSQARNTINGAGYQNANWRAILSRKITNLKCPTEVVDKSVSVKKTGRNTIGPHWLVKLKINLTKSGANG